MTADDADEVLSSVANVVSELDQDDERSEDNLGLIAGVFDQIDTLISDNVFNVSDDVSTEYCI